MVIRVLLADDEALARSALRMLCEADGHQVVGEAEDGVTAVMLAQQLAPDVVLMDIRMPRLDGVQATRLIVERGGPVAPAVVVVTTFDLDETVLAALQAGARGFLVKNGSPRLVQEAVRAAADGQSIVSPSTTARLLQHFVHHSASPPPAGADGSADDSGKDLRGPLTDREGEVVALVAQGLTNAEIAQRTVVTVSTVKAHLASAQRKLGVRNRTEVALWAWEHGLLHR